jgi:hypothetical protein
MKDIINAALPGLPKEQRNIKSLGHLFLPVQAWEYHELSGHLTATEPTRQVFKLVTHPSLFLLPSSLCWLYRY